jgi:hypothetical protein
MIFITSDQRDTKKREYSNEKPSKTVAQKLYSAIIGV